MSISLYFGLPGVGKTTLLTKMALKKSRKYENVYVNVHLSGLPPNVRYIENEYIGKFNLSNCLILIDEGTLFADNRDYKNFSKSLVSFFMLHRHYCADICIFSQTYNGVDKKIRTLCDKVFYMYKPFLTGWYKTKYYRIHYGIVIPDRRMNKQNNSGQKLGEIEEGYCKPSLFERMFAHSFNRRPYYKYFDSWDAPKLPELPEVITS